MGEIIAIIDSFSLLKEEKLNLVLLKRLGLFFNRIAIPHLAENWFSEKYVQDSNASAVAELRWLLDNNIIFEPQLSLDGSEDKEFDYAIFQGIKHAINTVSVILGIDPIQMTQTTGIPERNKLVLKRLEILKNSSDEELNLLVNKDKFFLYTREMASHFVRAYAIQMRELHQLDTYPILPAPFLESKNSQSIKNNVIQIILNSLPMPDDATSWEQLVDFRSDPDSYSKFLALRNWTNEVARGSLTAIEIEQKLEYLLEPVMNFDK